MLACNVSGAFLVGFFPVSYWSAGVGTFLAFHWLKDFADGTPTAKKTTSKKSLVRHLQQANQPL